MQIEVKAEIVVPEVPRSFKLTNGASIPVTALADESLEAIGREWTIKLIQSKHAKK